MRYALLQDNIVTSIFEITTSPVPVVIAPYILIQIADGVVVHDGDVYNPQTQTFSTPVEDTRPWLRLLSLNPDTQEPQTKVFEVLTGETFPLPANKMCILVGTIIDGPGGDIISDYNGGPYVVRVPHPRGGIILASYRVENGVLQMETAENGWMSAIPFYSYEPGELDLAEVMKQHFRVESPLVLQVFSG